MRRFSYDFWRDFASILSYVFVALSLIGDELIGKKYIVIIGIISVSICAIGMIIEELKRNK
jgi:hypothetical protein